MKEFEKWLEKGCHGPGTGSYPRFGTVDEDQAAEEGWKAALEHIYNDVIAPYKTDAENVDAVFNAIKQELNDQT